MEKQISTEGINIIKNQIGKHLEDYLTEINRAYETMGEVSISLSCKLVPAKGGNIQIQTNISFIESKIKDKELIIV